MSNSLFSHAVDRRAVLRAGMLGALGVAAAPALSACGSGGGAASGLAWQAWASPGEAARFKEISTDLGKKLNAKFDFQAVVGDYDTKLLSQLSGGAAPDVFYVGGSSMAKYVDANAVTDLTDYLNSGKAPIKLDDFHPGLYQWCKPSGSGIYGLPVDCNPSVLWFNKDVLQAAGVSEDPSQQFEAGTWTFDALTDVLDKVRASGKKGLVFDKYWFNWAWAITANGGKIVDDSGKLVFADDPKAQEGLTWMLEQFKSGNITYAGSLPKGQSGDAFFFAGQLAMDNVGRWILPNLKDLKFGYDIAPVPSPSGKDIMPAPVTVSAIAVNAKAKNKDLALEFVGNYVSPEWVKARLSGGGNAVPAVKGVEDVAAENGLPAHGKLFNDIVAKGYATPNVFVADPKKYSQLGSIVDKLFTDPTTTAASFSSAITKLYG